MTSSRKRTQGEAPSPPPLDPAAIDVLLGDRQTMDELDEVFRQLKQVIYQRALALREEAAALQYPSDDAFWDALFGLELGEDRR